MHGENLLIDDCCNREAVETVRKCFPQLDIIPTLTLVIEAIDSIDGGTFVVSSEDEEILGILDLVRKEQADCFERLFASIDIISKEEVVGLGREATVFEKSQQIVVLAVNITANLIPRVSHNCCFIVQISSIYLDWCLQFQQYRLGDKDFSGFGAQISNFCF